MALLGRLGVWLKCTSVLLPSLPINHFTTSTSNYCLYHVTCSLESAHSIRAALAANKIESNLFMDRSIEQCLQRTSPFTNEREAVLILNVNHDS